VVNDPDSVKEVLIAKGSHFDGRPDFKRFDLLFGGDKQNCESNSSNLIYNDDFTIRFRRLTWPLKTNLNTNLGYGTFSGTEVKKGKLLFEIGRVNES
jgi:hypothetical protein